MPENERDESCLKIMHIETQNVRCYGTGRKDGMSGQEGSGFKVADKFLFGKIKLSLRNS